MLRFIPSFSFGYGVLNLGNRSLYATIVGSKKKAGVYEMDIAGGDIVFMAWTGVFYLILVFVIEALSSMGSFT